MMKSILILLSLQAYCCLAFSAQSPFKAVSKTQSSNINDRQSSNIVLSSSTNNDDGPLGFLQGIFSSSSAVAVAPEPELPDFVVDSDYTIAGVSFVHMTCTLSYLSKNDMIMICTYYFI